MHTRNHFCSFYIVVLCWGWNTSVRGIHFHVVVKCSYFGHVFCFGRYKETAIKLSYPIFLLMKYIHTNKNRWWLLRREPLSEICPRVGRWQQENHFPSQTWDSSSKNSEESMKQSLSSSDSSTHIYLYTMEQVYGKATLPSTTVLCLAMSLKRI